MWWCPLCRSLLYIGKTRVVVAAGGRTCGSPCQSVERTREGAGGVGGQEQQPCNLVVTGELWYRVQWLVLESQALLNCTRP